MTAIFRSTVEPRLTVVDKVAGGNKAVERNPRVDTAAFEQP